MKTVVQAQEELRAVAYDGGTSPTPPAASMQAISKIEDQIRFLSTLDDSSQKGEQHLSLLSDMSPKAIEATTTLGRLMELVRATIAGTKADGADSSGGESVHALASLAAEAAEVIHTLVHMLASAGEAAAHAPSTHRVPALSAAGPALAAWQMSRASRSSGPPDCRLDCLLLRCVERRR